MSLCLSRKRFLCTVLIAVQALALSAQTPVAEPSPAASPGDYARSFWHETVYVATAPTRWDDSNWLEFGAAGIGIVGTAALLDRPIRNAAQRNHGSGLEHFANNFEKFGAEYSFGVLGVFYAEGWIASTPRERLVGEDGLTASILSGSVTFALKESVGRSRPSANRGVYHFSPFSGKASFPSGHATQAFAVASVIAARYHDNIWVDSAAYGVATLVGIARVDHNAHFASDVLAGALIGGTIGRAVVNGRNAMGNNISVAPVAGPHFAGVSASIVF